MTMLRAAGLTTVRRLATQQVAPSRSAVVAAAAAAAANPRVFFSSESAPEVLTASKGWWEPIYGVPIGLAFAIPALKYEWILVNEETQLAICFIAFTAIVYKQFGGLIQETLEADGKRLLDEHNRVEDEVITMLQDKIRDIEFQSNVVQDAHDVKALKLATYEKLNAAGLIKPQYDFKNQMERIVHMIETEEVSMTEKAKIALMEEATINVLSQFKTSADLKKSSLANAIAALKGSKTAASDPVKTAYLKFFADKKAASAKVDEKAEIKAARDSLITKLNAVAKNEEFFFQFGPDGKPKMVV